MAASVDERYRRHIKPLSPTDRRRPLALLARDLTADEAGERSLLELEGLGEERWRDVDA
jgi:hypothetical protein